LNFLRSKKNLPPLPEAGPSWREKLLQELDALADFLESHLDFQALEKILAL
jgi:cobyric acid synthase